MLTQIRKNSNIGRLYQKRRCAFKVSTLKSLLGRSSCQTDSSHLVFNPSLLSSQAAIIVILLWSYLGGVFFKAKTDLFEVCCVILQMFMSFLTAESSLSLSKRQPTPQGQPMWKNINTKQLFRPQSHCITYNYIPSTTMLCTCSGTNERMDGGNDLWTLES